MFFELIATLTAGFAAAGAMLLVNRLTGRRLPRWLIPVAAGAAMIGVTISSEYGWFGRNLAALPDGLVVVRQVEERAFYRPWTYAAPYVSRFIALDQASIRTNAAVPEQRMADLYVFGRWAPPRKVPVLIDCAGARRADLVDEVRFADDGQVEDAAWQQLEAGDALIGAACVET
jgi:hypothetical protein